LPEGLYVGDVKVKDPLGSGAGGVERRGAHVAFGNTEPGARCEVLGLKARGRPGTAFNPLTGEGYVAAKAGAYERAVANGVKVEPLLFETFGGFGPDVVRLLRLAADTRGNKLRGSPSTTRRRGRRARGSATRRNASRVLWRARSLGSWPRQWS